MATKKFIIEVEEGWTKCDKDCPFAGAAFLGYQCGLHNEIGFGDLQCNKYNLATMRIKEYNEPNCYNLQCLDRNPNKKLEEEK